MWLVNSTVEIEQAQCSCRGRKWIFKLIHLRMWTCIPCIPINTNESVFHYNVVTTQASVRQNFKLRFRYLKPVYDDERYAIFLYWSPLNVCVSYGKEFVLLDFSSSIPTWYDILLMDYHLAVVVIYHHPKILQPKKYKLTYYATFCTKY